MWTLSVDFRDRMEDLCRFQLEQSDLVQGYSLSADVTSGHGSLANILIESFIREETPKAPILLYAAESTNQFKPSVVDTNQQYKHDLFNLNQALWIGQLSKQANLVIPFNEEAMGSIKNDIIERYKGKEYLYHRSALQALVMNSVTSQVKIQKDEEYTGQRDLDSFVRDVLYSETPNIVVPSLRVPFSLTGRFTQGLKPEDFVKTINVNSTSLLRAHPLRHTFLINGAKTLVVDGESPQHFDNHVNSVCRKVRFERGYHLAIKGDPVLLPLPFPRIFTPKCLTENGLLKEKEDRQKDDFVLSMPMMTRLAQDGSYVGQVQNAYLKLKGMRPALRM